MKIISCLLKYSITNDSVRQSRGIMPKGLTVRKVRASGERITDNVRRWRHPGKCNRNRQPQLFAVMMERRGKSSPIRMATYVCCKPYPKQPLNGSPPYAAAMPQPFWRRTCGEIHRGVSWQHGIEIDDCPRQNPAYRQCHLILNIKGSCRTSVQQLPFFSFFI